VTWPKVTIYTAPATPPLAAACCYDDRPTASELARDAYEDDRPERDEDNACPECDDGIVITEAACASGPHRGPAGPNEDLDQCGFCWSVSYVLRPEGETYGLHLPDCSLSERHEGHCAPGGSGHPRATTIAGYFPTGLGWHDTDCTGGRHADDGTCPSRTPVPS